MDYACYRQPQELLMSRADFLHRLRLAGTFTEASLGFMDKITMRSGVGDHACSPPAMWEVPPNTTVEMEQSSARGLMFSCVQDLLRKTGLKGRQVDVLVVNCSLYCPTPSLSAAIVNHFKMREDVKTFNLGGMGCSANVIAVALVNDILKVRGVGRRRERRE